MSTGGLAATEGRLIERLLAAWASHFKAALVIVDGDGQAIFWNHAAAALLEVDPARPRPVALAALLGRASAQAIDAVIDPLLRSEASEFELTLAAAAGRPPRLLYLQATHWGARDPLDTGPDNQWIGLLLEDRSARRREEEELTRLASFPELDPNPILEVDAAGAVTYMNAAAEELAEAGAVTTLQAALPGLMAPQPSDRGPRLIRELRLGETWFELGIHRIAEFKLTRIYAQDISDRKAAEAAALAARRDLERRVHERTQDLAAANSRLQHEVEVRRHAEATALAANQSKSAFLANMSHELRTPLNAIIGYAELIREDSVDDNDHDNANDNANDHAAATDEGSRSVVANLGDLERILGAAHHLLSLINNVLDISKIEAGKVEVCLAELDLGDLLEGVMATISGLVSDGGNHLEASWSTPTLGTIVSDRLKIRQILINLLGNAAKFTRDGVITLRATRAPATASSDTTGATVRIEVVDTGPGIDTATQARLFRPFVQAAGSAADHPGGTGLGLAISAEYARLLGGSLTVRSTLGEGSTFSLILPTSGPGGAAKAGVVGLGADGDRIPKREPA